MRILVLEDDRDQALLLEAWLLKGGHACHTVASGSAFLKAFGQESYDLVMLDWMVPEGNGLEILKAIREHFNSSIPVVFVTQRDAEGDIVRALENGADDYIVKPLREAETLARISALARRSNDQTVVTDEALEFPPYSIDLANHELRLDGKVVEMTQKEFDLALFLFRNVGRVVSRGHMLEMVWATSSKLNTRTVDTHMSRLRTKLSIDEQAGWALTSIYRHGYRLERIEGETLDTAVSTDDSAV